MMKKKTLEQLKKLTPEQMDKAIAVLGQSDEYAKFLLLHMAGDDAPDPHPVAAIGGLLTIICQVAAHYGMTHEFIEEGLSAAWEHWAPVKKQVLQ